ncbi:hypothetical protein GCM10027020_26390 [Nocardioides salsibiostraticola]
MPLLRRSVTVLAVLLGLVLGALTAHAALRAQDDGAGATAARRTVSTPPGPPMSPEPTTPPATSAPIPVKAPVKAPEPQVKPVAPPPAPALFAIGDEGDGVLELQARLRQIYWFNTDVTGYYGEVTEQAVRGFQVKRGIAVTGSVDQETMNRLLAMTTEPSAAELANQVGHNQPGALDARCTQGRVICIDKTSRTLRWVVDGDVRSTIDVRFGAVATPTREGVFDVYVKSRDHVSSLYDSAMPFAMFFDGGQAVHYSSDFAATGYNGASHGCVNVRDRGAVEALFDQIRLGDTVVVYRS